MQELLYAGFLVGGIKGANFFYNTYYIRRMDIWGYYFIIYIIGGEKIGKKIKKYIILVSISVMILIVEIFVSNAKFSVANPFAVLNGLYQITFTDKQYAQIQAYPKVIIAKPQTSLESYMETKGFSENKAEQLGALRIFENDDAQQYVLYSVNKYFSKWHWKE